MAKTSRRARLFAKFSVSGWTLISVIGSFVILASVLSWGVVQSNRRSDEVSAKTVAGVRCIIERLSEFRLQGRLTSAQLAQGQGSTISLPPSLEPDVLQADLLNACKGFLSGQRIDVAELLRELPNAEPATLPPAATGTTTTTTAPVRRAAVKKPATRPSTAPSVKPTTSTTRPPPPSTPPTTACVAPALPAVCGLPVENP